MFRLHALVVLACVCASMQGGLTQEVVQGSRALLQSRKLSGVGAGLRGLDLLCLKLELFDQYACKPRPKAGGAGGDGGGDMGGGGSTGGDDEGGESGDGATANKIINAKYVLEKTKNDVEIEKGGDRRSLLGSSGGDKDVTVIKIVNAKVYVNKKTNEIEIEGGDMEMDGTMMGGGDRRRALLNSDGDKDYNVIKVVNAKVYANKRDNEIQIEGTDAGGDKSSKYGTGKGDGDKDVNVISLINAGVALESSKNDVKVDKKGGDRRALLADSGKAAGLLDRGGMKADRWRQLLCLKWSLFNPDACKPQPAQQAAPKPKKKKADNVVVIEIINAKAAIESKTTKIEKGDDDDDDDDK